MDTKDWVSEDFLEDIYGERKGFVDLPSKLNGHWVPHTVPWPNDVNVSGHLDGAAQSGEDVYFSGAMFSEPSRKEEFALPPQWLWADLDPVHPAEAAKVGLFPTLAFETSPGRYQAMWRLEKRVPPARHTEVNRALSYALGADPSGYDITQVLRMPVTRNHKYDGDPMVTCLWYEPDKIYTTHEVMRKIKHLAPPMEVQAAFENTIERTKMPGKVRRLLLTPKELAKGDDRSKMLWMIEMGLAESGFTAEEIYKLVWPCAWNKWREVGTGHKRLEQEIRRAIGKARSKHDTRTQDASGRKASTASRSDSRRSDGVPVRASQEIHGRVAGDDGRVDADESTDGDLPERAVLDGERFAGFVAGVTRRQRWTIDGILPTQCQGFIAGEPKTSKSMVALSIGMATASGRDLWNTYRVRDPGPVIIVDCETGRETTQDRMRRIGTKMGIISPGDVVIEGKRVMLSLPEPMDIPLTIITDQIMNLDSRGENGYLAALTEHISREEPKLIILDPLYFMLGDVNANREEQLRPVLQSLSQIRRDAGCSIMIVHHYNKPNETNKGSREGQRIVGSFALNAWWSSSLFCESAQDPRGDEGWTRVEINTRHRASSSRKKITLAWTMEEDDNGLGMDWEVNKPVREVESGEKVVLIERLVREEGEKSRQALMEATTWGRQAVDRHAGESERLEWFKKGREVWYRYV